MALSEQAARLGVRYRPAEEEDLPFLAEVYFSTRAEELAVTGWPEDVQRAFLAHPFDAQHRHYRQHYLNAEWLVVEKSGEPIGRLYLDEWSDQLRLVDIALLPHARGEGIGSAILADLMKQAAAVGKPLTIHVEKNNPAMRLYLRLGFAPIDEHGVYDLMEWRPEGATAS